MKKHLNEAIERKTAVHGEIRAQIVLIYGAPVSISPA